MPPSIGKMKVETSPPSPDSKMNVFRVTRNAEG